MEEDTVCFSVIDDGHGLTKEDLSNFFKPFPEIYVDRVTHGTGLGLSLMESEMAQPSHLLYQKKIGDVYPERKHVTVDLIPSICRIVSMTMFWSSVVLAASIIA